MMALQFRREVARIKDAITKAPLREFAVPHIVVDNILSDSLVTRINQNWPSYEEGFSAEVRGNHIFQIYRRNYSQFDQSHLSFWWKFNERLWPHVVAAVAEKFRAPCGAVFGDLFYKHLKLDHPLTLMQADSEYSGHSMHHHFYHAPHWAFTMLLYIDPQDTCSQGTALHRLLPLDNSGDLLTSYQERDLDWRAEVAIDTFHWKDPLKPDRVYDEQVVDYKCNRLFVFLDGPLALHSVPFDGNDHRTTRLERGKDGGQHARRRILRSHVKVHHDPFYRRHSANLPEPLDPEIYMQLLGPNAVLSDQDKHYRDTVIHPFFVERLKAYVRAAKVIGEQEHTKQSGGWNRFQEFLKSARMRRSLALIP